MTIENASPIDLAAAGIQLDANQIPARFYRGGDRIAAFRRTGRAEPYTPEDWVASTTSAFGSADLGLSRLPGGEFLIDAIRRDPEFWLGAAHRASFDSDSMLLVKLLDAGERLPIHVHPDGAFASEHLRAPHGKAEAWYILTPGVIRLGLKRDISRIELERAVAEHDGRTLLELTHEREVAAGDTVFVPPGTLHAIGGGSSSSRCRSRPTSRSSSSGRDSRSTEIVTATSGWDSTWHSTRWTRAGGPPMRSMR
ncbi:hypothetical protein GCM10025870_28240 [Agromyces marinus]|uniref:Mannose-6-phosphate isomerase n=1 Tax=Agromyces marinus TaxID=1389020 RepID=A0ABN6YF23_9MICO|nr:hypothetical protein [Agromyces marinus]BDZ55751.1 hypothetical protein GCM10025870_28240 [Agromyces marinus]